jgi:hypothetical protein
MMALDGLSAAASIAGIIQVVARASSLIRGIHRAPLEAKQVQVQLNAASAILASLKASLDAIHRPRDFLRAWGDSTHLVWENIRLTLSELTASLGIDNGAASHLRLSFWSRIKWTLSRPQTLMLQQQLHGYIQMLGLAQNSLLQ